LSTPQYEGQFQFLPQEPNQPIGVSSEVDLANAIIGKVLLWII